MDLDAMREAVREGRVRWHAHVLERMLARSILTSDVRHVLLTGDAIEDYADDHPFASVLLMAFCADRPLHAVVAYSPESGYAYVVTAYEPDTEHFEPDFRTRRGRG